MSVASRDPCFAQDDGNQLPATTPATLSIRVKTARRRHHWRWGRGTDGRDLRSEGGREVIRSSRPRRSARRSHRRRGRCNVTHDIVTRGFHGSNRNHIAKVLGASRCRPRRLFRVDRCELKREEGGKLSRRPTAPHGPRRTSRSRRGAAPGSRPVARSTYRENSEGFSLTTTRARSRLRPLVATGGRSVPKTGSDGSGYELVRSLDNRDTDQARTRSSPSPKGHWMTAFRGSVPRPSSESRKPAEDPGTKTRLDAHHALRLSARRLDISRT